MKTSAWFIFTVAATLLCLPLVTMADKGPSDRINWATYTSAQDRKDESRKYFIYFYSDRCGYCTMLEKKTFSDKAVIEYINANYTPVKVNANKEFNVASKFGIQGVPDLRFLTSKGDNIARWPGFIETKRLLPLLEYIHTDSYENTTYRDFLKRQKKKQ